MHNLQVTELGRLYPLVKKYWGYVTREKILGYIFCDDGLIGFDQVKVAPAHPGGNFKPHVKQLAQAGVVSG